MIEEKKLPFYFVVFICLVTMNFWSFRLIPEVAYNFAELGLTIVLIFIFINYYRIISQLHLPFWRNIKVFLIISVLLGSIAAFVFHDQAFHYSLWRQRSHFLWLLYPVLHLLGVSPKKLVNMMILFGAVWCVLNIFQQLTYPVYWFASRVEGENAKEELLRAGVYRFMPNLFHYGMFLGFYCYQKFLDEKRLLYALGIVLTLLGFYYFGTRQFIFGFVVCMIIFTFLHRGSSKIFGLVLLGFIALFIFSYQEQILGGFIDMTNTQLQNEEYIRFLSADFFLYEYWPHWMAVFTGNGLAYIESSFGKETEYIHNVLGFYASDVGIIGSLNNFGIFYVINVFILLWRISKTKFNNPSNIYLKLFAINAVLLILLTEYFMIASAIPFWCIILYLIDRDAEDAEFTDDALITNKQDYEYKI